MSDRPAIRGCPKGGESAYKYAVEKRTRRGDTHRAVGRSLLGAGLVEEVVLPWFHDRRIFQWREETWRLVDWGGGVGEET